MSDKKSAYAALISNISEKDRAKDVVQFDDILRTFTNEINKFENRFGKIRDEEKMLAVNIVDKVASVPTARSGKQDTGAPMEIGMAAKEDEENASQEGDQRIIDLALQADHKGMGKGGLWQGSELE